AVSWRSFKKTLRIMADSSHRLRSLMDRARGVFERTYGPSEGCFAAHSPARVNLMGDYVEGCGGLVLQVALDRRLVVFGRGRLVNAFKRPP
ncbi:unnamed protein product, partial [Discosporangium mesarthrocarpum]